MRRIGYGLAAVALAATACGGTSKASNEDSGALLACQQFRSLAGDYSTLTTSEVRDQLKKVYDHAKAADHEQIRTLARTMLEQQTQTGDAGPDNVTAFGNECKALGY